jgi:hypothetical protein
MPPHEQPETLAQDLLIGAAAIAEFIGISERACRHQLDRGQIPHRRMGRLIVGSKRVLRCHFSPEPEQAA